MPSTQELLTNGYFPRELPPAFTTAIFASFAATNPTQGCFGDAGYSSTPLAHTVARPDGRRRLLTIPNPASFLRLASEVSTHWADLQAHCQQSPYSSTTPSDAADIGRAIGFSLHRVDHDVRRSARRTTARFAVVADVVACYPSIYTHSIPWALHTKPIAKANHSNVLLGNRLDRHIRNGQDRQTVGIPIGPDTSLVIAETILTSVDLQVHSAYPQVLGVRFIDDYEFYTATRSEADHVLTELHTALAEFELSLNPLKTRVVQLPHEIVVDWPTTLSQIGIRDAPLRQQNDIVKYFSAAARLARQYPTDSIFRYAVASLQDFNVHPDVWSSMQHHLLHAAVVEPGCLPWVIAKLWDGHQSIAPIDLNSVSATVNDIILNHAVRRQANEVAWAVWAALLFQTQISEPAAGALSHLDDGIVAVAALYARDAGLIAAGLDTTLWEQSMTADHLNGRRWLLAYEANVNGWLPSIGGGDHVAADAGFGAMKAAGVRFFDFNAAPVSPFMLRPSPRPILAPAHGGGGGGGGY